MQTKNILLLLLLLPLLACNNNEITNKTESENPPTETLNRKVVINGNPINYSAYGSGDYSLLFLHGWCINQTYWKDQVEVLKDNYKIVTADLPGFGNSGKTKTDWSIEAYGQDIKLLIDSLDLEKVILIGHSMSGDVILETALDNEKVVALVGVDNFKDVVETVDPAVKAEMDGFLEMLQADFTNVVMGYAQAALFLPTSDSLVVQQVLNDFSSADSTIAYQSLKELINYAQKEAAQLSQLEQKLYLINSDATPTDTAVLNAIGLNYQVVDIPQTGHYPMVEKPTEFTNLLIGVLKEVVSND
ncbi:MAG: alpha/beta hydrolase [Bacteroidota bacterium]